ncbi:MAG: hypothetical protein ACOCWJ_02030 [Verrucomicrobiota bacterium]
MKSAYELAMERMGASLKEYSDEQKEQMAEIDRKYDALVAEAKLNARRRAMEAPESEEETSPEEDLAVELASIEERRERDKQKIRECTPETD